MMRCFRLLFTLVVMLLVLPVAGCEDKVTQANFDKITNGMRLDEVETILGGKGELETVMGGGISASGISTATTAPPNIYKWQSGVKIITVTVMDGKVVDKGKDRF